LIDESERSLSVLDTMVDLRHCTDVWLEITMLLISGHNDSDPEIDAECAHTRAS
jgi:pyruvate formate lyase activating enzyme